MQSVWPSATASPSSTNGGSPGRGRAVEGADHRALDAPRGPSCAGGISGSSSSPGARGAAADGDDGRQLGRAAHAHAHAALLDRDLVDAGLLHDLDDGADALLAVLLDALRAGRLVAARALADRPQQPLGVVAEQREQQQLLLARGEALRALAQRVEVDRLLGVRLAAQADRALRAPGRSGRASCRSGR